MCKKEVNLKKNDSIKSSKVQVFYNSSNYIKSNYEQKFESSKKLLKEIDLSSSDKYLIFNNLSYLYSKQGKLDSAILFSKKMLELSDVKTEDRLKGKVFFKIGSYFKKLNLIDSSYFYFTKSQEYFLKIKDSINISKALINLATIESEITSFHNSDSTAVRALKFLNGREVNFIAKTYNCLAINSKKRSLYKDAVTYYNTAIEFSKNKNSKIIYKNNIANVYKEEKKYSKAILILENLIKQSISNQKTKARIIDNLAYTKWLKNSKEEVLKDLLLAEKIRIKENDYYGLIASYSHLSDYFRNTIQKKSLIYAVKAYRISKKINSVKGKIEALDKIVSLQSPQKAIKYYQESIHLRDSLEDSETKREYKFAKIKYDFEEEEKQKLKFRNLAIENQLIAEQENNQKKNIFIFAILTTIGFVFYIYRRKQQHKKQILQETYKTETRIAKNLHDDLGNGIYNVITKVLNPKFQTEEVVKDLDKIYLKTREISHQNDVIETGDKFENYFKELVSNYNLKTCNIIVKDLHVLDLNSLPEQKQIVIYRVFNELLVNMKKHSNASLVVISCSKKNNFYEVIYKDNGIGFKNKNIVFKNGLKNMETRIKSIMGSIKFEKKLENGFKATILFKK